MKTVIQAVLIVAICVMAYFVYESIQQPIRFNKEQDKRYKVTIQRLRDIRTAQVAYKAEKKEYTPNFDSLIHFLKTGNFQVVKQIGDEDDSAAGPVIRETILIGVLDSLFEKNYAVDSLRYVPFTENAQFEMDTATLEAGRVKVHVFEARVLNQVLLHGLDPQLLVNFDSARVRMVKYAGLKVGSVKEPNNNAGNWGGE
ncbi:MAG: hypothetical protein LBS09_10005 [Bacteroidales bacterium]|jgi:hypothetical protein|nr:hypothetical protein [Bacteroidales bacterium]